MNVYWISLATLFALTFSSCSSSPATSESPPDSPSTNSQPQEGATRMPSDYSSGNQISPVNTLDASEVTPPPADANPFVKMVEEDLASQLNITTDQINFLKISEIDWPDITQGCTSTAGQTLTKGRVFGYRIWLQANGKNYLYHIGLDNKIYPCPD